MNKVKKAMIQQAIKKYRQIYPCGVRKDLGDCFTIMDDRVVFWFNTSDNSTHLLTMPRKPAAAGAV